MALKTTAIENGKQIFKYIYGLGSPVTISSADVTAVGGKKIVPAGSVIGTAETGKTVLLDHSKGKVANNATAEGILSHDVDVTDGDAVGTIITRGVVYANALPAEIATAAATALRFISQEN